MTEEKWILTKVFHPKKFEEGIYVVDFWIKGKPKIDINLKRFQLKAKTRAEAIGKAKAILKGTKTHIPDLKRDRQIKAKHNRKSFQPTWRGDLKGSRI